HDMRWRTHAVQRPGHRNWHRARATELAISRVPADRERAYPPLPRHRPGPGDQPAADGADGRRAVSRKYTWRRLDLSLRCAPGIRALVGASRPCGVTASPP